jgi:glycosyltransferase involved in cell wall biosynthesis
MLPSFRSAVARRLNRSLLLWALTPAVATLPEPPVVVTTLPLVADLVGRLPAHRWVYYCVDDFSAWPGYDGDTMLRMERDLVPKADAVIAVSDTLVEHLRRLGKPAHLLTHGVDLDRWRSMTAAVVPAEFEGLAWPLVLFWGVIDRRTDTAFIRQLSSAMTDGTIVLVGPREDPDPELLRLPRVAVRPAVPFERLPALASAAAVLVMPYTDSPATRAMQPLKMKEYVATGRPVVVRDLPATRPWADCLDVADTPGRFAGLVLERLRTGVPVRQQLARGRLEGEGWDEKARQFEAWIDGPGGG